MFHLAGETVISLPKPDIDVISLELNGDVFDCSDFKNQLLSLRCMVLQSTVIEPNPEVIVPVIFHKRSCNVHPKSF